MAIAVPAARPDARRLAPTRDRRCDRAADVVQPGQAPASWYAGASKGPRHRCGLRLTSGSRACLQTPSWRASRCAPATCSRTLFPYPLLCAPPPDFQARMSSVLTFPLTHTRAHRTRPRRCCSCSTATTPARCWSRSPTVRPSSDPPSDRKAVRCVCVRESEGVY